MQNDAFADIQREVNILGEKVKDLEKNVNDLKKGKEVLSRSYFDVSREVALTRNDLSYILKQLEKMEKEMVESHEIIHKRINGTKHDIHEHKDEDVDEYKGYKQTIISSILQLIVGTIIGALLSQVITKT